MHSFMKISSRNVKISLALTDLRNSCPSREFEAWQICLLKQFARIKFSQKVLKFTVQYIKVKRLTLVYRMLKLTNLTLCMLGNFSYFNFCWS